MKHTLLQSRVFAKRLKVRAASASRNASTNTSFFKVSKEIQDAITSKKPVVALETTIYTHGFPCPENIALSSHLESIVRTNGGIPATIGVLHGVAKIGFEPEELIELLVSAGNIDTIKVSRRDLSYICGLGIDGRKLNGGTTVAATMLLAQLAGIKVFATGGLGGVHQNGQNSMDISADLTELGRTPVALVSSGCKSFLDIPRTLEYLETQGVGVSTFADGRTEGVDFPAFWTRDSGIASPSVVKDEKEAATIIFAQMNLPLSSGLFFANPIPTGYSLPKHEMDVIMTAATQEAYQLGMSGSNNTPFILKRIRELTRGKTITANRALIEANVLRGTRVAVELAKLERTTEGVLKANHPMQAGSAIKGIISTEQQYISNVKKGQLSNTRTQSTTTGEHFQPTSNRKAVDIVVAGSLAIDLSCNYTPQHHKKSNNPTPMLETSNPAIISQSLGGVGQNVATALHYLDTTVRLCSAVGDDVAGRTALNVLGELNMLTDGITIKSNGPRTAQFVAFNDSQKQLVMAMADMTILEGTASELPAYWNTQLDQHTPKWLVLDSNWDSTTLSAWVNIAKRRGVKIAYEPVSAEKSTRIFGPESIPLYKLEETVDLATPNEIELKSMHDMLSNLFLSSGKPWDTFTELMTRGISTYNNNDKHIPAYQDIAEIKLARYSNTRLVKRQIPQKAIELLPFIPCILTKLGPEGVLMTQLLYPGDPKLSDPAAEPHTVIRFPPDFNPPNPKPKPHNDNDSHRPLPPPSTPAAAGIYMRLFPPAQHVPPDQIISVNGVGDTFLGVLMAGLIRENAKAVEDLVTIAQRGAVMTLKSKESVSPEIAGLRELL